MSTEPRKFIELGSDLLVKTTSFQKAANGRFNTRKKKSQEFSGDSFVNSAWQAFLFSSLTTGNVHPDHPTLWIQQKQRIRRILEKHMYLLFGFFLPLYYIYKIFAILTKIYKKTESKKAVLGITQEAVHFLF